MPDKHDVCVIGGCGHVGLPLSIAFAIQGKRVAIVDINPKSVEQVRKGIMPFTECGAAENLRKALETRTLEIFTEDNVVSEARYIIIVIGTPVDEHLNPRMQDIFTVVRKLLDRLQHGQTIILRSTVYPGTSEKIHSYLEREGKRVHVSYCPERIAQGHAMKELFSLPQIISSFDQKGLELTKELFECLTKDIVVMKPMEAELAKLFTNSWRYIKFAAANQFYMIAESYGLDFYKIYEGMTYKYPRIQDLPRAGFAAGPCLFKDTMQLASFNKNNFMLGHAAMLVNEGLPNFIVDHLKRSYTLRDLTVGILGMAFKADVDDTRESLSYKLKKNLEIECKEVLCSDPFVKDPSFVAEEDLIKSVDVVILGVPHSSYKKLATSLAQSGKHLVDVWNFFKNEKEADK